MSYRSYNNERVINIDSSQINNIMKGLEALEKQIPGAACSAINRTTDYIGTKIAKMVTSEYAIKSTDVKKTLTKRRANKSNLLAYIQSKGYRLSIAHFPFSPKQSGALKQVKVKIKKTEGSKKLGVSPSGFVGGTGAKSEDMVQFNVFKRFGNGQKIKMKKGFNTGLQKERIHVIRTVSIPQMIMSVNVNKNLQEEANKKLQERIEHEINYRLKKVKA